MNIFKKILVVLAVITNVTLFHAYAGSGGVGYPYTMEPTFSDSVYTYTYTCTNFANCDNYHWIKDSSNNIVDTWIGSSPHNYTFTANGSYTIVDEVFGVVGSMEITSIVPPPPQNGLATLITSSGNKFASTTGFSPSEAVVWTGLNLIKPIISGGVNLLYSLRYWIIALIVLSAIVYFAYRAFKFYRH